MAHYSRGVFPPIQRLACAIAAAVLLISVFLVGINPGANGQGYNDCDVNLSGQETITDALLVAQHVVRLTTLTGESLAKADCNGSTTVTISDGLLIAQRVVGLA